jgi:hypothetical protein
MRRIYLTTFRPLRRTAAGRRAIAKCDLPPFVDDSCRREPDFQSRFPSISALCRGTLFAPKLRIDDVAVYMTKKIGGRWLPAILQVIERFETHEDAAEWYAGRGLPTPSNCMVAGNPPIPIDQTSQAEPLEKWDAGYRWRARKTGTFLATMPLFLELRDPPSLPEELLIRIFGQIPGTQNPRRISERELQELCDGVGIGLEERKREAAPH